jgi:hypothetical protein
VEDLKRMLALDEELLPKLYALSESLMEIVYPERLMKRELRRAGIPDRQTRSFLHGERYQPQRANPLRPGIYMFSVSGPQCA